MTQLSTMLLEANFATLQLPQGLQGDPAPAADPPAAAPAAPTPATEQPPVIGREALGALPYGMFDPAHAPAYLTSETLMQMYRDPSQVVDFKMGWFSKVKSAFMYETVIGELIRDQFLSPHFDEDPNFRVTDELLNKYGSDLPEETQKRVAEGSESFLEFLHELDDARIMHRRRNALFEGGFWGAVGGFTASMLAMGSEAVLATAGIMTATTAATGPGAVVAAPAASAAVLTSRLARIKSVWGTLSRTRRVQAATKALGVTALVDLPLEYTRYKNDKTLTTTDLLVALGASATMGAGLGAWKPHMFDRVAREMMMDGVRAEAGLAAKAAGASDDLAEAVGRPSPAAVHVTTEDAIFEATLGLKGSQLDAERARLGISKYSKGKKKLADEIRIEIAQHRRALNIDDLTPDQARIEAEALGIPLRARDKSGKMRPLSGRGLRKKISDAHEGVDIIDQSVKQVERQMEGASLRTLMGMALDMGGEASAAVRQLFRQSKMGVDFLSKGVREHATDVLKKAITTQARKEASVGRMPRANPAGLPKKLAKALGGKVRIKARGVSHTLIFKTDVEKALWKIGIGRDNQETKRLVKALEDMGVIDPVKLAKRLRKRIKKTLDESMIGKGKRGLKKGERGLFRRKGTNVIEVNGELVMDGVQITPKTMTKHFMDIDEDLIARKGRNQAPRRDPNAEDPPHPVADAPEEVLRNIATGEETGRAPSTGTKPDTGVRTIDPSDETLKKQSTSKGVTLDTEEGIGEAEAFARWVEGATKWTEDMPPIISHILSFIQTHTTPTAVKLMTFHSKALKGDRFGGLYKAVNVWFEQPRGTGMNLYTILRMNHQNTMNELASGLHQARQAAKALGNSLTDNQIVRALTTEIKDELDEPLQMAVAAIVRFNNKLKAHAQKYGLLKNNPNLDPNRYFHRIWRNTEFTKHAKFEKQMVRYFTQAILSGNAGNVERGVARQAARRIVEFGLHPDAARNAQKTRTWIEGIRRPIYDGARAKGLTDKQAKKQVSDIVDVVVGHLGREGKLEPHISGFAKQRIKLNENYVGKINGTDIHIDEFMHRDILEVTSQYAHKVLGAVEIKKGMQAVFGDSNITIAEAVERIVATVDDANKEYTRNALQFQLRRLSGIPVWEGKHSPKVMAGILNAQALAQGTMGMKLGIAQLPEIMNIMLRPGLMSALRALPSLKTFRNTFLMGIREGEAGVRGADGRLLDKLAAEMETFTGVGGEYFTHEHLLRRLDDMGFDKGTGVNNFLDTGRRISMLNPLGIIPMDTFLRRWGAKAEFQNIVNTAFQLKNGKPVLTDTFFRHHKTRLHQLGLNDTDIKQVFRMLTQKDVISVRKGVFGNYRVMDIDFTKVKDKGAYDKLALAVRRSVDSMVQRQSLGEIPLWMNASPWAKLLTQYRVFSVASRSKQLAAGLARFDGTEAINMVGSIGLGFTGYTLLTYSRALGLRPSERRNYLAKRLNFEESLKSGIMRSSYASIVPMLIDSAVKPFMGGEGVFDASGRTTRQGVGLLEGTVPWSLAKNISKIGYQGVGDIFTSQRMSKEDMRNIMRIAWFLQIPGVNETANLFTSGLENVPATNRRR